MGRNLDGTKAITDKCLCLTDKTWTKIITHTTDEETVWEATLHLHKIVVLDTVDKLLCDHSCRNLRIIHIGKEHLSRVSSVNHEWGQHLHFLVEEKRTRGITLRSLNLQVIPRRILFQPKMRVRINYVFFHLTRI